jgi:ribosomal protein S18 acetylase RimI-like enzyme
MSDRMDISYRYAEPRDAGEIASLIERAYGGRASVKGWTHQAGIIGGPRSSMDEVQTVILSPGSRFLVASAGDDIVGCAFVRHEDTGALVGLFSVEPSFQELGIGRTLLSSCEATARELWDAKYLRLTVISIRHELIAWYERRGFQDSGRREAFPFGPMTAALRTDFDLVEMQKQIP